MLQKSFLQVRKVIFNNSVSTDIFIRNEEGDDGNDDDGVSSGLRRSSLCFSEI